MTQPRGWLTMNQAAEQLQRSRRTIRRWLADPDLKIRTKEVAGIRLINGDDLARVEHFKWAYMQNPTFGRRTSALIDTRRTT